MIGRLRDLDPDILSGVDFSMQATQLIEADWRSAEASIRPLLISLASKTPADRWGSELAACQLADELHEWPQELESRLDVAERLMKGARDATQRRQLLLKSSAHASPNWISWRSGLGLSRYREDLERVLLGGHEAYGLTDSVPKALIAINVAMFEVSGESSALERGLSLRSRTSRGRIGRSRCARHAQRHLRVARVLFRIAQTQWSETLLSEVVDTLRDLMQAVEPLRLNPETFLDYDIARSVRGALAHALQVRYTMSGSVDDLDAAIAIRSARGGEGLEMA